MRRVLTHLAALGAGVLLAHLAPRRSTSPAHLDDRAHRLSHPSTPDSLIERVYPLHALAQPWQEVPFARYDVLLVTGPQRSGTTWAACALASSLGYTLYDERHPITGGNDTLKALRRTFAYLRETKTKAVIQSPMATQVLHLLPFFPGLLIVFIARNCLDVFMSQNKVDRFRGGWTCTAGRTKELRKYRNRLEIRDYFDDREMICKIKQDVWLKHQRGEAERRRLEQPARYGSFNLSATVEFDSFRSHPLWMRRKDRKRLSVKETNCAAVRETPARSRWNSRKWFDESQAALDRLEQVEPTSPEMLSLVTT